MSVNDKCSATMPRPILKRIPSSWLMPWYQQILTLLQNICKILHMCQKYFRWPLGVGELTLLSDPLARSQTQALAHRERERLASYQKPTPVFVLSGIMPLCFVSPQKILNRHWKDVSDMRLIERFWSAIAKVLTLTRYFWWTNTHWKLFRLNLTLLCKIFWMTKIGRSNDFTRVTNKQRLLAYWCFLMSTRLRCMQ